MRATKHAKQLGANELVDLIRGYVIQETLVPLKRLGRTLAYGLAGGLATGIGLVLILVGVLRILETETASTFAGSWSFAPYALTLVAGIALAAAVAVGGFRIGRGARQRSSS